jgi:hypothetical protein
MGSQHSFSLAIGAPAMSMMKVRASFGGMRAESGRGAAAVPGGSPGVAVALARRNHCACEQREANAACEA